MDTPVVQPPIPPVPQPVPPSPKKNSGILIGILLLIFGIIIGLMIDKTPLLSALRIPYLGAKPTQTSIPIPTQTPEQLNTTNWKTYINTKNMYSVKIPPGWEPERGNPAGGYTDEELQELDRMYWSKNNSSFSVQVLNSCTNLEICFKEFQTAADASADTFGGRYTTKAFKTTQGTYQGIPSIEARSTYGETVNAVKGIFFVYKGKLWLLETQSLPSFKEADQILSTFRFLDQTTDTSNWKTYTDNDYNFLFKYPSVWEFDTLKYDNNTSKMVFLDTHKIVFPTENVHARLGLVNIQVQHHPKDTNYIQKFIKGTPSTIGVDQISALQTEEVTTPDDTRRGMQDIHYIGYTFDYQNEWLYTLSMQSDNATYQQNKLTFTQLLSTFRFVRQ
ncbi:MAG: hypothetical protein NT149_00160 [Candidatus Gottesmanbacteria bacterium]|nr:hypothetical protein [Candidatus Gottesmanbacteria bacterium]